jgi:hypothetical protein
MEIKFIIMARMKGIQGEISFHYDKRRRYWLVRLEGTASPQIIGNSALDVAFNIGNGFLNRVYNQ